jgi:hypothetical protein
MSNLSNFAPLTLQDAILLGFVQRNRRIIQPSNEGCHIRPQAWRLDFCDRADVDATHGLLIFL